MWYLMSREFSKNLIHFNEQLILTKTTLNKQELEDLQQLKLLHNLFVFIDFNTGTTLNAFYEEIV